MISGHTNILTDYEREHHLTDAFWLRQYAGMAMQGIVGRPHGDFESVQEIASHSVTYAFALLDEIKRRKQENDKQ